MVSPNLFLICTCLLVLEIHTGELLCVFLSGHLDVYPLFVTFPEIPKPVGMTVWGDYAPQGTFDNVVTTWGGGCIGI